MKFYIILICICILTSCSKIEECDILKIRFPSPANSALILEFDDIWEYSDSIKDVICRAGLSSVYLDINDKHLQYSSSIIPSYCSDIIICGPSKSRDRLEVLINRENTILIEGEIIDLESVDSMFTEVYMNPSNTVGYFETRKNTAIEVKWDVKADKTKVKEVIVKLLDGYSSVIKSIYLNTKRAALCDSISSNLQKIEREYPFNLLLHFGLEYTLGGNVPPPPPPPMDQGCIPDYD